MVQVTGITISNWNTPHFFLRHQEKIKESSVSDIFIWTGSIDQECFLNISEAIKNAIVDRLVLDY